MTRTSDPEQYAMYLRDGNIIEIGGNKYEVQGGDFIPSEEVPALPLFRTKLTLISMVDVPRDNLRPTLHEATLIVDPRTIIPVLE